MPPVQLGIPAAITTGPLSSDGSVRHIGRQSSAKSGVCDELGAHCASAETPQRLDALTTTTLTGLRSSTPNAHDSVTRNLTGRALNGLARITGALPSLLAGMGSAVSRLGSAALRRLSGAPERTRENYYFQQGGAQNNVHTVIHTSAVRSTSAGLKQQAYFQNLGDSRHRLFDNESVSSKQLSEWAKTFPDPVIRKLAVQGLRRRAEQEYLLQHMAKGAMFSAAQIADKHQTGIVVRGTGLSAHMGIESGMPTKAQEYKNKTSKDIDLWLCAELKHRDVGAVVHYDPRVGWTSKDAGRKPLVPATEADFQEKLAWIKGPHKAALEKELGGRIGPMPSDSELRKAFFSRATEYVEEDNAYRHGHFAASTVLDGPHVRLKARPDENMVGDHDLFVFTNKDGSLKKENPVNVQKALQSSNEFQAQHGAIWYWKPEGNFNTNIRNTIMNAHSNSSDEPMIHIQPGNRVSAVFYDESGKLSSVWDDQNKSSTGWLAKTHSGSFLAGLEG